MEAQGRYLQLILENAKELASQSHGVIDETNNGCVDLRPNTSTPKASTFCPTSSLPFVIPKTTTQPIASIIEMIQGVAAENSTHNRNLLQYPVSDTLILNQDPNWDATKSQRDHVQGAHLESCLLIGDVFMNDHSSNTNTNEFSEEVNSHSLSRTTDGWDMFSTNAYDTMPYPMW